MFGIAFYASRVLECPPIFAFYALRFYRERIAGCPDWSAAADRITGTARKELEGWLALLLQNVPVSLGARPELSPDVVIFSDASAWGWGATASRGGLPSHDSAPWTPADRTEWNCNSSVIAEPLGLFAAAAALVRPTDKVVELHTDHIGLVYAFGRGYGKSFAYNNAISRLAAVFPGVAFRVLFVPGLQNPADRLSRGWVEEEDLDTGCLSVCPSWATAAPSSFATFG